MAECSFKHFTELFWNVPGPVPASAGSTVHEQNIPIEQPPLSASAHYQSTMLLYIVWMFYSLYISSSVDLRVEAKLKEIWAKTDLWFQEVTKKMLPSLTSVWRTESWAAQAELWVFLLTPLSISYFIRMSHVEAFNCGLVHRWLQVITHTTNAVLCWR